MGQGRPRGIDGVQSIANASSSAATAARPRAIVISRSYPGVVNY
jgi:hypothetical protein